MVAIYDSIILTFSQRARPQDARGLGQGHLLHPLTLALLPTYLIVCKHYGFKNYSIKNHSNSNN